MRSHFRMSSNAAVACAVAGAATMLNGHCAAQNFIAADYATDSAYAHGWYDGQSAGYGFGPWSFYNTDPTPGDQQTNTSSAPLGTSWTLFNLSSSSGLADAGRAISEPGGLQVGQTIETFIENPSTNLFYRGWTIAFDNGTNNLAGGDHTGEQVSAYHFEYFNYGQWSVSDLAGSTSTTLNATNTAPAGMKLDLTLTSTNTYHLVMTPLNNPTNSYSQDGSTAGAPINWIMFQLYNTVSSGPTDTADNFEIRSITIAGTILNVQKIGANLVFSWTTNTPDFNLASSPSLGAGATWSTNGLPVPVVINDQYVITNPIAGPKQFYRLQQ